MRYEPVRMAGIPVEGPEAGRFSFRFEPETGDLERSIQAVGLVRTPILRRRGNGHEIVCGFRRVLACNRLGLDEIRALVCETDELSDERCLWFSLIDNDCPGRMSPVERALALRRFSDEGYGAARLAREVAPRLGLPSSSGYVENHLGILSFEKTILRAIHEGSFGVEQAFCLRELEPESHLPVFRVLRACRANVNETRELVPMIVDVSAMRGVSVPAYVASEMDPVIGDESLSPRKRLDRIRDLLMKSRFPRLSEGEAAFAAVVSGMGLDECCSIRAPKYFEGDDISISLRVEDAGQLNRVLRKLSSAESEAGFRKLFSIIRGGKS